MKHVLPALGLIIALTCAAAARSPLRDIRYGPDPKQALDVYRPGTANGAPIIVMLHGGAWAIGDKSNKAVWQDKSRHWTARGFLFVSVNTRLLPQATPAAQAQDFARAVAHVQARATAWGGDPRNVIVMGHSAGAHIAALVGTDLDLQRTHNIAPLRGAVVLDTAALDLQGLMRNAPARLYRKAFGPDPRTWQDLSPLAQIDRNAPPVLAVCSTRRDNVCPAARAFADKAKTKSVPVSILPIDLSHRAVNARLGQNSAYTRAVTDWIEKQLR